MATSAGQKTRCVTEVVIGWYSKLDSDRHVILVKARSTVLYSKQKNWHCVQLLPQVVVHFYCYTMLRLFQYGELFSMKTV